MKTTTLLGNKKKPTAMWHFKNQLSNQKKYCTQKWKKFPKPVL
jgi:hypothetical protein